MFIMPILSMPPGRDQRGQPARYQETRNTPMTIDSSLISKGKGKKKRLFRREGQRQEEFLCFFSSEEICSRI